MEQTSLLNASEYQQSHNAKVARDAAEARMQQARVDREMQRQAKERARLDKGYEIERERFEREWDARGAALEAESARRIRVLEEVHRFALEAHEANAAVKRGAAHYRMSKSLLEYSLTEKQLALDERFDEAIIVKKRTDRMRARYGAEPLASRLQCHRLTACAHAGPRSLGFDTAAAFPGAQG